jgi:hypothetical protein
MNPVDHPHGVCVINITLDHKILIKNRVVTINILVRLLQSRDMLHKAKRLVSSLLGELVCCGVLRRSRIRWLDIWGGSHCIGLAGFAFMCLSDGLEHCENEYKT